MVFTAILFFIAAIGAITGAIGVVMLRNPFYSVLALAFHLVSLAALFLLLRAGFLAAAQVIVADPEIILTWDRNFFTQVYNDPVWAQIPAVKEKRVYLSPRVPFGWIDAPPSVGRRSNLRGWPSETVATMAVGISRAVVSPCQATLSLPLR